MPRLSGPFDDIPVAGYHYQDDATARAEEILSAGVMSVANYVADYYHALERKSEWPSGVLVLSVGGGSDGVNHFRRVLCEPFATPSGAAVRGTGDYHRAESLSLIPYPLSTNDKAPASQVG